jgi:hypothetical protein
VAEKDGSNLGPARVRFRLVAGSCRSRGDDGNDVARGALPTVPATEWPWYCGFGGYLISAPDAAISKTLREQTRVVLATLTPRERQVLQMRFGISGSEVSCVVESGGGALTRNEIDLVVAKALRKLRQPGSMAHLRGIVRA